MEIVSSFDELLNNSSPEVVSDVSIFNFFAQRSIDTVPVEYNGRMVGVVEVEMFEADPPEVAESDPDIYEEDDLYTVTFYAAFDYGDGDWDVEYDGYVEPDAEFKTEEEARSYAEKLADMIETDLARGRNHYLSDEHLNKDYRRN